MPARLNVIMIESAPAAGSARRMAEAIVGELIGLAGIDLTLVESLDRISDTSTDKLTLDGISGDVCVLDWQSADVVVSELNDKGFAGRRAPHPHDLEAANAISSVSGDGPMRRIYAFELSRFSDAKELCEALSALRATREVRTFSLLAASSVAPRVVPQTVEKNKTQAAPLATLPASQDAKSDTLGKASNRNAPVSGIDLEALVDQLDEFDS